jgi:serine/threonine-protein kinase
MKKFFFWFIILFVAFGLGFLIFNLIIMPRIAGTGKNVTVPDVVGKSLAEAQKIILSQELEFGSVRAVYDTSYGHGFVVGQKPLAGSVVRSGRRVNLIVSKGPQIVKIPNLEQMSIDQGMRVLASLGISQISIDSLRSANIPSGKIIGIEPGPGSELPVSGAVKIFVSSGGSGVFLMPSLIGLPVDIALDTINYNGLILGSLQTIPSDEWPGLVIIQYPEAGMRVRTNDTVRMIVSRGQE